MIIATLGIVILQPVSAYINIDAVNNADTCVRIGQNTINYGNANILGIYGSGSRMNTIMSWTLPKINESIKEVSLSLYCRKWDDFPITPIELHVINEPFEESGATWSKNKYLTKWTDIGAGMPTSTNPAIVDPVPLRQE